LTSRLDALERRVCGAVDSATESVKDTAGTIKSTFTGAADKVQGLYQGATDSVKSAFDVQQHIRDCPWACVGAATFAGFLSGFFAPQARRFVSNRLSAASSGSASSYSSGRGVFGELTDMLKRELRTLGESAIMAATAALKDDVQHLAADFHPLRSVMQPHHNGHHAEAAAG